MRCLVSMRARARRSAIAGILLVPVLCGAPCCSGGQDADAPRDAAPDAVVDAADAVANPDGSDDADAGYGPCNHRKPCEGVGTTCTNDCAQPCTCILVSPPTSYYGWDCKKPVIGTTCSLGTSCPYPPDANDDIDWCRCIVPAGDQYWNCSKAESVCPTDPVESGTSCSEFPAGLLCGYTLDGGAPRDCQCTSSEGTKTWHCI
jgi:hypothetical protein